MADGPALMADPDFKETVGLFNTVLKEVRANRLRDNVDKIGANDSAEDPEQAAAALPMQDSSTEPTFVPIHEPASVDTPLVPD